MKDEDNLKYSRDAIEKKFTRLGVKVDWDKLSGTAYADNPQLLLDEYLLVKNTLGEIAGNVEPFPDYWLGSIASSGDGQMTNEEMRGLGML
jgi:hypothetical protein